MADLIPHGYLSLREVFRKHFERRFGVKHDHRVHGARERQNEIDRELLVALRDKRLEAFVRRPGETENMQMPSEFWDNIDGFNILLFTGEAIESGDPLVNLRTPFVDIRAFQTWSIQTCGDASQRSNHRPRDKRDAVVNALIACYQPFGDPGREKMDAVLATIRTEPGVGSASKDTLRRAIAEIRNRSSA